MESTTPSAMWGRHASTVSSTSAREASEFAFLDPYDFFIVQPDKFHFTSTYSPITILSYNTAGDRTNGEDHLKAFFAVNAGKDGGTGFKFDYIYGRGYYTSQSTSHFNYSMWASYLGDRYQAHLLLSTNHQKVAENGGITNDAYISHPERFNESFLPRTRFQPFSSATGTATTTKAYSSTTATA